MPYNPYQVYQPMYQGIPDMRQFQPQMQPAQMQSQQQSGSGIIWVQGEEGAKAYMVAPGNSVLLMDSENSAFYIKSTDSYKEAQETKGPFRAAIKGKDPSSVYDVLEKHFEILSVIAPKQYAAVMSALDKI